MLLCMAVVFAKAQGLSIQKGDGKISGVIIDSLSKQPVDFATVALEKWTDSKSVNGSISDEKGNFKLTGIGNGDYRLIVTFIGYKTTATKKITISDQNNVVKLGKIFLASSGKVLDEVTVVGQRELVENKIDKLVYNAEKDVTSKGGDAGDVLRKVPMVSVDIDGNVELRGSGNVKILINGKPSSLVNNNVADAMKMIPSNEIKNVEVITSPSAKYDAEGTSGIINIVTKKTNIAGVSGNISGTVGTRTNRGNGSLSYRTGKFGFNAGFGGMYFYPQDGSKTFLKNQFSNDTTRITSQNGVNSRGRNGGNMNFGVDYDINKTNSLSSSVKVNRRLSTNDASLLASYSTNYEGLLSQSYNSSTNNSNRAGLDWSTDYRKTFKKPQQELSFSFQLSNDEDNTDFSNHFLGISQPLDSTIRSYNAGKSHEITFQGDYAQPVSNKILLEIGGKTILRDATSDYSYEYKLAEGDFLPLSGFANAFDYTQNVYAGYSVLGFTFNKGYALKIGGRLERTEIRSNSQSSMISNNSNSYNNFIPSLTLAKNFADFSSLKVSYTKRIQRPSLRYLNPFIDTSDPLNSSFGNPNLLPEKTNSFELGYSKFFGRTSLNASVYYRNTSDVIESIVVPLDSIRSAISYANISKSSSVGVNLFGSVQVGQKVTLRGNANVYTYNAADSRVTTLYSNTSILYNMNLNASWNLPKDFVVEMFGMFNSPKRTIQGKNPSFSMFNVGFKKDVLGKRGSLGLNLSNPFNKDREFISSISGNGFNQYSQTSVPFRSLGVTFSYQFGKMDFRQQQQRSRSVGKKKGIQNDDLKQESDAQGQ